MNWLSSISAHILLVALITTSPHTYLFCATEPVRIVEMGIGIDREELIDEMRAFIKSFDETARFNFLLMDWRIVWHQDFLRFLSARGEIIPAFYYMQTLSPEERARCVDRNLETFKQVLGVYPNGTFQFQPDTFTVNYLAEKYGSRFVCGYCLDQYLIDYMTMRGGWQFPYYASTWNVQVPSKDPGVVVLPHITFDLAARYSMNHRWNTHPLNALEVTGGDTQRATAYITALINEALRATHPFGYARIEFEFSWAHKLGALPFIQDYYKGLRNRSDITFMTSNEVATWFRRNFATTPNYAIKFQSPSTGDTAEWSFNTKMRVMRNGSTILSLIDYTKQIPDKYLNLTAVVDFSKDWGLSNHIDTSLDYRIDALGGGVDNPTPAGTGVPYTQAPDLIEQFTGEGIPSASSVTQALILSLFTVLTVAILVARASRSVFLDFQSRRPACYGGSFSAWRSTDSMNWVLDSVYASRSNLCS